ncbi:MAG: sugar O-acetyltransferase [Bacteroidota bacterium]
MTEKEKMLAGQSYDSRDPELIARYHIARDLMKAYNQMDSRELEQRQEILGQLLGKAGKGVWIEAPFFCDYGEHIFIGENSFVNVNCMFLDNHEIHIGKNALIGPYVQIYTASHPLHAEDRIIQTPSQNETHYLTSSLPVYIGENVWIGGNTVIMPGVRIGDNVTIGAGSVVTKDIPDKVLAFGNPCKVNRSLAEK